MIFVYANKADFTTRGLEPIVPSYIHPMQDCSICLLSLATQPAYIKGVDAHEFHAAVRITACNHVIGSECLAAWHDASHTCPTCNRLLFEPEGFAITHSDVDAVVRSLGQRGYAERHVMRAIARMVVKAEKETKEVREKLERSMERLREQEWVRRREEEMTAKDFWSDSEEDFEFEEDGEEDMDMEDV